jgi:hypothetical protein
MAIDPAGNNDVVMISYYVRFGLFEPKGKGGAWDMTVVYIRFTPRKSQRQGKVKKVYAGYAHELCTADPARRGYLDLVSLL